MSQSKNAKFDFVQAQKVGFAKFVFILLFEFNDLLALLVVGEGDMVTRLQFQVLARFKTIENVVITVEILDYPLKPI